MAFIGLPIYIRPRKRCERCGLVYRKKLDQCPHCSHLTDGPELAALKEKQDQRLESSSQVGIWFLGIMVVLVLLLFLAL